MNYTVSSSVLFRENNPQYNVDICVNSDSDDLIKIATKDHNIVGIKRPSELAQDNSAKIPVIQHSLKFMEDLKDVKYDYVIDLDITSPLRAVEDIENALIKCIEIINADVVFSVVHSRRNPYFNMVEVVDSRTKKVIDSDFTTRQQAPKIFDMNASIYCYRRDSLFNVFKYSPFDGVAEVILMKDTAILDIDSEEDFELMELIAPYFLDNDFKELKEYIEVGGII